MKKLILVDGNNFLFRSYYATAYKGSILRNSKGFPTNALFGFISMLNKIINEENPEYMVVAFDKGKTFRHEMYENYKDGRKETPQPLVEQFPVAREIVKAMGITCLEIDNFEADDIIGTFAKMVDDSEDFESIIISSDKDLLQLISDKNEVKLLKSNDFIRLNKESFIEMYGFIPERVTDLKALMGDASDNIPGVKGIGEKGAISLIKKYGTIENLYNDIDNIKGKLHEKLEKDKENAYFSKKLATICKAVPLSLNLNDVKYNGITPKLIPLLKEYEFFSIIKKLDMKEEQEETIEYEIVSEIEINKDSSIYIETDGTYHDKVLLGIAISNSDGNFFIKKENINKIKFKKDVTLYTYDLKKLCMIFKYNDIVIENKINDIMLEAYLLNYNIKDDIYYLMNIFGYTSAPCEELVRIQSKATFEDIIENMIKKSNFIYKHRNEFYNELKKEGFLELYEKIDLPLAYVLMDMEYTGVNIDKNFLLSMKDEVHKKIEKVENEIYSLAGTNEFNLMSPKQLGVILFEKLEIPYPKRLKSGKSYSTSVDILSKLTDYEIVNKILEYRNLTKIYSNYIVGLIDCIKEDGKIHTIFTQTLTRTGRLSSISPNLQNIPVREGYGKLVRKAFIPSESSVIISSDYSQVELRVFASLSKASNLIEAFNNNFDIHTKTAMDIYNVPEKDVTSKMRREAKAVNFGILYGISSFGLSEDLGINLKEAKQFMDNYLEKYPGIKEYTNEIISKARENGYVKTLFGRKRVIDEINSANYMVKTSGERMALNTPIQGTSADILKIAMIEIYNEFKKRRLKAKMIIQVHDELLFDCPNNEYEEVVNIIRDKMENTYKMNVPLKVEIESGRNWYEAK